MVLNKLYCLNHFQIDGGSNISIKLCWSQKLSYNDGQFSLKVPFKFPEYVTPTIKKIPKKERIHLNVNAGTGNEVLCNTTSHPLKVHISSKLLLGFCLLLLFFEYLDECGIFII